MRRKQANVQHYEKQAYKKDRMVAKALIGAFSHVRVSLNIKQIEIFKMANIGKEYSGKIISLESVVNIRKTLNFQRVKKKAGKIISLQSTLTIRIT